MHHQLDLGGIELITGSSYLLILLGFALRQYLETSSPRLLWPWLLVSIFGLCGVTRMDYVGVVPLPDLFVLVLHLTLAAVSLAYGLGQLLYAFWPELFQDDTPMPRWATEDIEDQSPAEAAQSR